MKKPSFLKRLYENYLFLEILTKEEAEFLTEALSKYREEQKQEKEKNSNN